MSETILLSSMSESQRALGRCKHDGGHRRLERAFGLKRKHVSRLVYPVIRDKA